MRKLPKSFTSACSILCSSSSVWNFPLPTSSPGRGMAGFYIVATLTGLQCSLVVVLLCISLVTNDANHLFMGLFALPIFPLMLCMCKSFAHFLTGLFVTEFWKLFMKFFSRYMLCKYFLPVQGLTFHATVFLEERNL